MCMYTMYRYMYMYRRTCIYMYITISSMNYIIVLLCTPSSACQLVQHFL